MTIWTTLKQFVSRQASTDMSPWGDYWYTPRIPNSAAGVAVSPEVAQQITTISACVKLISETAATVPLILYKEIPAGKERANDTPLSILLRKRPNRWQTSLAWRGMMTGHAALRGVAYSEMVPSGGTIELIPRHPDRVRPIQMDTSGFTTVYGVRDIQSGVERNVPATKMFVLEGPWQGRSPIDIHREAIALGLAMQEQSGRFFGNGSRPGGVLKSPEGAKYTKEQREELKRSWEDAHRGPSNSNRVAVLEGGLEWQQIGLSADDSQFVQSRLFHVAELCRIWNVPPYKVQEYGRATWANTEQQAIEFLTTCMLPWFRRWEEAIGWYLIEDGEPYFAEFLLEGLLRGDTATRYAAYQIATGGKAWMSPNEIRELENRNRVDGLDEVSQIAQGAAPGKPSQPPQKPQDNPDDNQVVQKPDHGEVGDALQSRVWTVGGTSTTGFGQSIGGFNLLNGGSAEAVIWKAWAASVAESLAKAEAQEYDRAPKDAEARSSYMATWRQSRFRALVQQKCEPMKAVWRGPNSFDVTVAAIVGDNPVNRKEAIIDILTQGDTRESLAA